MFIRTVSYAPFRGPGRAAGFGGPAGCQGAAHNSSNVFPPKRKAPVSTQAREELLVSGDLLALEGQRLRGALAEAREKVAALEGSALQARFEAQQAKRALEVLRPSGLSSF